MTEQAWDFGGCGAAADGFAAMDSPDPTRRIGDLRAIRLLTKVRVGRDIQLGHEQAGGWAMSKSGRAAVAVLTAGAILFLADWLDLARQPFVRDLVRQEPRITRRGRC